jgi:cytochrome c oxidase subunit 2
MQAIIINIVPESDLEEGGLRMLEVDNRVIIPEYTHARFIVTAGDVIHSIACPLLGLYLRGQE